MLAIAPRGAGKSSTAARALLWFCFTRPDSLGIILGPTKRQVEGAVMAELASLFHRSKLPTLFPAANITGGGVDFDDRPLWRVVGLSSDAPANIEGLHSSRGVLVVVDEGRAVEDAFFSSIMGSVISPDSKVLAISTAGAPSGWLYRGAHGGERAFWDSVVILTAADVPWVQEAAERERKRLGDDDPTYRQQWRSEFSSVTESALFTPEILARGWNFDPHAAEGMVVRLNGQDVELWGSPRRRVLGVDIARTGDKTIACLLTGRKVERFETLPNVGEMACAANIYALAHRVHAAEVVVDEAGQGHGVYDRTWDLAVNDRLLVSGFSAGRKATDADTFQNIKSETSYWLRKQILDKRFGLGPVNETLSNEMLAIRQTQDAKGRIRTVDPSRSPDTFDSLLIACSALVVDENPELFTYSMEGV